MTVLWHLMEFQTVYLKDFFLFHLLWRDTEVCRDAAEECYQWFWSSSRPEMTRNAAESFHTCNPRSPLNACYFDFC